MRRRDHFRRERLQHLPINPRVDLSELGRPIIRAKRGPLVEDEIQKSENGGQFTFGNDRIATIEAASEGMAERRSGFGERTAIEPGTARQPDILRSCLRNVIVA